MPSRPVAMPPSSVTTTFEPTAVTGPVVSISR
jgi:hypothetical protein